MKHDITNIPERYLFEVEQNERFNDAGLFVTPSEHDINDYRSWARRHYKPEDKIVATWHPACVAECLDIIREFINGN